MFGELSFVKEECFNFKNLIRVFERNAYTGDVREAREVYIRKEEEEVYVVNEYLLDALKRGIIRIGTTETELIAAPQVRKIVRTSYVYVNCPLWTKWWEGWIFEAWCGYVAYLVSPRVSCSLDHLVTKYPCRLRKLEDSHIREVLKIRDIQEGYCVFCGEPLPQEPDGHEYGLGGEVEFFICPNCGEKNYGFRWGQLFVWTHGGASV